MSKKQRDSLYAEVQKHQQSQECVVHSAREESVDISDHGCAYRRGSGTALGDLDEITTLPEGLLFDLPLTPEDGGGDYCNLEMLGGSAGSSLSSHSSPEQNNLDCVDKHGIKHEYQLLHDSGLFSHAIHTPLPEPCSLLDTGQYKHHRHLLTACWYAVWPLEAAYQHDRPLFLSVAERITQSVIKSHIETSQYSTEELKRMAWTLYSPEETHSYQMKVQIVWHQAVKVHTFATPKVSV